MTLKTAHTHSLRKLRRTTFYLRINDHVVKSVAGEIDEY